jgi:hypothetical protein
MVELRDGSAWRIWPGDISKTLRSARADPLLNFQVLLVKTAKAQFLISRRSEGASIPIAPQRSWGFDLQPIPNHLSLDPGLDFVVHDDGAIGLTETGFRRIAQAHSAGLDAVIGVDRRPRGEKSKR